MMVRIGREDIPEFGGLVPPFISTNNDTGTVGYVLLPRNTKGAPNMTVTLSGFPLSFASGNASVRATIIITTSGYAMDQKSVGTQWA